MKLLHHYNLENSIFQVKNEHLITKETTGFVQVMENLECHGI